MWMKALSLSLALVLLGATFAAAQRNAGAIAVFANGKHSVTIPLDIDNNIIRMKVRVNGSRELLMIFDTGATVTGIDEHFVKELGLITSGDTLKGSGAGGNFTGGYVKSSTLSVDGVEVSGQPLAAFKINAPPGFEFDGIVGYDFIRAFVIEIDWDKKAMTLTDPRTFIYRGKGTTVPLNLTNRKTPLIASTLRSTKRFNLFPNLELDTGYDAAFMLSGRYVAKNRLLHRLVYTGKASAAHGAGGDQERVLVNFATAAFGGVTFKKPPIFLSLGTTGSDADKTSDGIIGGEALRRFNVIIDYARSRMILEKNEHFNEPFDVEDGE
jgi:hypothetical protein